jgi:hypothetical protein
MSASALQPGTEYSWEEMAAAFGFQPDYLGAAGGMISRPEMGALLLITRPDPAVIDYHDYWDGNDLIYAGRGQVGDQELKGQNFDLAENRSTNYVFVSKGQRRMRFHGIAHCVEWWWDRGPDRNGTERKVIRYRLQFSDKVLPQSDQDSVEAVPGEPMLVPLLGKLTGMEGRRLLVRHQRIERDRAITRSAKRIWAKHDPLLRCDVCAFSFAEKYGDLGKDFIQAHHRVPLGKLDITQTSVEDLVPVCANCHCMLHQGDGCTVEELRERLQIQAATDRLS